MFQILIDAASAFLQANVVLVGLIISITEWAKSLLAGQAWFQGWHITLFAFILSFLFVIPPAGFVGIDWVSYVVNSVAVGLSATGLFKLGSTLATRAGEVSRGIQQ